jgi:type VI secretion system protein ImpC
MAHPGPGVRSEKPLRAAKIDVEDVPGDAGWYKCTLTISPHFKYMGADITLSLVGKLEKAA